MESSFFYGTHSLRRLTFMTRFRVTDDCNGCGLCAKLCPVHATRPEFALLRNRKQYTHPDIKLTELLQDEQR